MPTLFFKNQPYNQFETTWNTANISTGSSTITQIKLPLTSNGLYDFTVDWGDGNTDKITVFNAANVTHTYSISGIYTIKIVGLCRGWQFNNTGDRLKLLTIAKWGCLRFSAITNDFNGCANLTISATDYPFLGNLGTMTSFFRGCSLLTQVPGLASWNTANVNSFSNMFLNCSVFNQNINSLNVSKSTTFSSTFQGCTLYNQPMSSWNITLATTIINMFNGCVAFDQDISAWNISSVTTGTNFLASGALSKSNYNKLLATWSAITSPQTPRNSVTISFGSSHYDSSTGGFDGTAGRAVLTGTYSWTITDGGTP